VLCLAAGGAACDSFGDTGEPIHWSYRVVNVYPHDPNAFTQGLVVHEGQLYEGTGLEGESSLRRVDLASGRVDRRRALDDRYFGEGIAILDRRIYQLTWQSRVGFIYDLETFERLGTFAYEGEGWGLTHDGDELIMSDGTPVVRFLDPDTLEVTRTITVRDGDTPVGELNELEYIEGEVWANVWRTDRIVRFDPADGRVVGWVDFGDLYPRRAANADVLNGIAYDADAERIFITGKNWPQLYEIVLERP
jgi:glutamine cyclotransferase